MTRCSPFRDFKTSPEIIRLAVMMYIRFPLSLRSVEDLLHERGIDICHETVRFWWHRFGPMFAGEIRKRRIEGMRSSQWRWHLDEMLVKINGETHHLWRVVDQEGEVLESFVTKTRDRQAALKFLRKAMRKHGKPEVIVTDKLRSYGAALRELGAIDKQRTDRWTNNRAENSHLPFRRRERAMLRFRRMRSLQKFATVHSSVHNHFNLERHLTSRDNFTANRNRRSRPVAGALCSLNDRHLPTLRLVRICRDSAFLSENGSSYVDANLADYLDAKGMDNVRGAARCTVSRSAMETAIGLRPMADGKDRDVASNHEEPCAAGKLFAAGRSGTPDRRLRRLQCPQYASRLPSSSGCLS